MAVCYYELCILCHKKEIASLKVNYQASNVVTFKQIIILKRSAYKRGHKKCLKGGVLVVVEICVECSEVVIDVYFVVFGVQSLSVTRTSLDRCVTVVAMRRMMIVRGG